MNLFLYSVLGILVILLGAVSFIPKKSITTKSIRFDATIEEVWNVYTDPESQSEWRPDVGHVEMADDGQSWTEKLQQSGLVLEFRILEKSAPNRFVLKTGAANYFEGRYVAEFKEVDGKTIGTFMEEATALGVIPKLFRYFFFDQGAFIDQYAKHAAFEVERRRQN